MKLNNLLFALKEITGWRIMLEEKGIWLITIQSLCCTSLVLWPSGIFLKLSGLPWREAVLWLSSLIQVSFLYCWCHFSPCDLPHNVNGSFLYYALCRVELNFCLLSFFSFLRSKKRIFNFLDARKRGDFGWFGAISVKLQMCCYCGTHYPSSLSICHVVS